MQNWIKQTSKAQVESALQRLIKDPKTPISALLDDQTFVNLYKEGDPKVTHFMKYDKLETLVEYITQVGPENDINRSYKFPMVACQMLSCGNHLTIDSFFSNGPMYIEEKVLKQVKQYKKETVETQGNKEEQSDTLSESSESQYSDIDSSLSSYQSSQNTSSQGQRSFSSDIEQPSQETNIPSPKFKLRKISREVQPLIQKLFDYFHGEVNYILSGYVCKVLNSFLNQKAMFVMEYLLENQKIEAMINHIESKSISQFLINLMVFDLEEEYKTRGKMFLQLLNAVNKCDPFHVCNLASTICAIIEKIAGNQSLITYQKLNKQLFTENNMKKVFEISNLQIFFKSGYTLQILKTWLLYALPLMSLTQQTTVYIKEKLDKFLEFSLKKIKGKSQSSSIFGRGRLQLLEIIFLLLKKDIYDFKAQLSRNKDFFQVLLSIYPNYPNNNITHNSVYKIIEFILKMPENDILKQSLFNDSFILDFLVKEIEDDKIGKVNFKNKKSYSGYLYKIIEKLKESKENIYLANNLSSDEKYEKVQKQFFNSQSQKQNFPLAGYQIQNKPYKVQYSHQKILQKHQNFLKSSPISLFQQNKLDSINIQHPDLVQAELLQDFPQSAQQIKVVAKILKVEQEIGKIDPKYWSCHLAYDIDELINDV